MDVDTLWLRSDSTAEELGAFTLRRAGAGGEAPHWEYDTTTVRGMFRTDGRTATVRTWMGTDDPLTFVGDGSRALRRFNMYPVPTAPRVQLTYERLP